jgi:signal transduction histidine kinase
MDQPIAQRRPSQMLHRLIDRVVVLQQPRRLSWLTIGALSGGFVLCYAITHVVGPEYVSSTWYVPLILAAAARFRYAGALIAAIAATVLSGPLRPVSTGGTAEHAWFWAGRGVIFALLGLVMAALIDRIIADQERELELAEQERDLAVRQAAVIATVSHEFRTPLTVISGVARTMEAHHMVTAEAEPLLAGLMDAARRLTDLVNTVGAVLDGSGEGTFVRLEPVLLRDVLDRVLDHLGIRDPRSRVSVEIDASAEIFVSDRELLSQLLRHVIENAAKFSPTEERVEVYASRESGRLTIRVRDRGPGIDATLLESPLPFTQGDRSMTRTVQGLGLGLFAASRLATALAGSIRFAPRLGGGTEAFVEVSAPDASDPTAGGMPRVAIA